MSHRRMSALSEGLGNLRARAGAGIDRLIGMQLIQRCPEAMGVLRLELNLAIGNQAELRKRLDD